MSFAGRLAVIVGAVLLGLAGWAVGRQTGLLSGVSLALALLVVPWRGQPLWAWAGHRLRRDRSAELCDPVTVANDRSGGGVRYQGGIAATAIQILGKAHRPTLITGATTTHTANTIDLDVLHPLMSQSLGLRIESMSVISLGARRRDSGDYPRVYDSLVGPPPYAGRRETWLVVRIRALDNGEALRGRTTVGAAAVAATQRVAAELRRRGIRARVATATDITALEGLAIGNSTDPRNRRWNALRGERGSTTAYGYRPDQTTAAALAQAWSFRADGVIQNITVFPDRTCWASVTVRTAQQPADSPSTTLIALPGEQVRAAALNCCAPRPMLRGLPRGPLPRNLTIPVGPSGVLLGRIDSGDRFLLPLNDPGSSSRTRIAADDSIVKRIVIRAAAAGERITVHTSDPDRWDSVRMPDIVVTGQPRPAPGTTISVTDGSVTPTPRPRAVVHAYPAGTTLGPEPGDIVITQTGPASIRVHAAGGDHEVEMEFFRAENRYLSRPAMAQ